MTDLPSWLRPQVDLDDLRRVRLHGGTRVHAVVTEDRTRMTVCGKNVKLYGPTGRPYDQPLTPSTSITCTACARTGEDR